MSQFSINTGKGRNKGRRKKLILTEPKFAREKPFKVRLDAKTVITLGKLSSFAFWKQRYPNAEIIKAPDNAK